MSETRQPLPKLLLRAKDACEVLSISRPTLHKWVQKGKLPKPHKIDGGSFWKASDLKSFVDSLADQVADCD